MGALEATAAVDAAEVDPAAAALAEVGLCERERKKAADCRKDSLPGLSSPRADRDPLLGHNSIPFMNCFTANIFPLVKK